MSFVAFTVEFASFSLMTQLLVTLFAIIKSNSLQVLFCGTEACLISSDDCLKHSALCAKSHVVRFLSK